MTESPAKGRAMAARVVSGLLGLAILGMTQAYLSLFLEDPMGPHGTHEYFNVIYGLALGVPLLVVALRPSTSVGVLRFAFAAAAAGLIGTVAARDFAVELVVWSVFLLVPAPLVALIGGIKMWRSAWIETGNLLWLSLLLLAGFSAYLMDQFSLQANGSASDPHWEFRHYSYSAIAVLTVGLGGLVASAATPGRRAAGVLVGLTAALLGLGSMIIGTVSAYGTLAETGLIIGGAAFVILSRRAPESAS